MASRILLQPEVAEFDFGQGREWYKWKGRPRIWKGTGKQCTILGSPGLEYLTVVGVRQLIDDLPVYLTRKTGPYQEVIFQGRNIDYQTVEVTLGEMGAMLANPEGGPYVGHFM